MCEDSGEMEAIYLLALYVTEKQEKTIRSLFKRRKWLFQTAEISVIEKGICYAAIKENEGDGITNCGEEYNNTHYTFDNIFVCNECQQEFTSISDLSQHSCQKTSIVSSVNNSVSIEDDKVIKKGRKSKSKKPSIRGKYRPRSACKKHDCVSCERSFGNRNDLERHARTHTGEKPYLCSLCGKNFADASSARRHNKIHSTRKYYICSLCQVPFLTKSYLTKHYKKQHMTAGTVSNDHVEFQPVVCQSLSEIVVKSQMHDETEMIDEGQTHVVNHSDILNVLHAADSMPNPTVENVPLVNQGIIENVEQLDCFESSPVIKKTLSKESGIENNIHDINEKEYHGNKCQTADKQLPMATEDLREATIEKHKMEFYEIITDENLFKKFHGKKLQKCAICSKVSRCRRDLMRHLRTHTGEKPFSCAVCGRRFSDDCSLRRHKRSHTRTKKVSCCICGMKFVRKSLLHTHYMDSHSVTEELIERDKCTEGMEESPDKVKDNPLTEQTSESLHNHDNKIGSKGIIPSGLNKLEISNNPHTQANNLSKDSANFSETEAPLIKNSNLNCMNDSPAKLKFEETSCIENNDGTNDTEIANTENTVCSRPCKRPRSKKLQVSVGQESKRRKFSCIFCGKLESCSRDLQRHARTHTREKPYSCQACGRKFSDPCSLRRHSRKLHNINVQISSDCGN